MNKGDIIKISGRIYRVVKHRQVSWEEEKFDDPIDAVYLGKTYRWTGTQVEAEFRIVGYYEPVEEIIPGYIDGETFECFMVAPLQDARYYKPFEVLKSQIVNESPAG